MARLYLITNDRQNPHNPECVEYLQAAAKKLGLECELIVTTELTTTEATQIITQEGDMLYRVSLGEKAVAIEGVMLMLNPSLKSLYANRRHNSLGYPWASALRYAAAGLPIIPSEIGLRKFEPSELDEIVTRLGGYPIVLKSSGKSHGVGVQLIDNAQALSAILNDATKEQLVRYALRKYLAEYRHARLIVLGDEVIGSLEYFKPDNDFRTNATNAPDVQLATFSPEINQLAIDATKNHNDDTLFGGVDILIDQQDQKAYIAEVNFPCNFARYQLAGGDDVAVKILQFLSNLTD